MELTLELEEPLTLFRVLCDGKVSHTFDLLTLVLPDREAVQGILQEPEAYGKRLYTALFPTDSLALRTLERGPTRLLLVAKHTAVAAVPWELAYGSADFLVRELSFERGLPPMLPDRTPFVSQGRQLFDHVCAGASENSRSLLAGMLFTMAEIYYLIRYEKDFPLGKGQIWYEQFIPPAKDLYLAALELYRELGDRAREALTLRRLGEASEHRWTMARSLPFYNEALELYRELGDREHEAMLLYELGCCYNRTEYAPSSFEVFSEALPIFRELGDREHEALILYSMAVDSHRHVSKQEAVELYREALALHREVGGKKQFEVILLKGLAHQLREVQQHEEALDVCEQLIQCTKGHSPVFDEINGLSLKTRLLHENLKRPAEALRALDQALKLLRREKRFPKITQNVFKLMVKQREKIRQHLSPHQRRMDTLKRFFTGRLYRR